VRAAALAPAARADIPTVAPGYVDSALIDIQVLPEPTTLVALSLVGMLALRRRA